MPIRKPGTKEFEFTKLRESGASDTLRHQTLTVQMVSNPSWYAVMALPYLMEFPHECTEQTFNRLYAEHFETNRPTRTTVEVGALPTPIAVELKVVAWTGSDPP